MRDLMRITVALVWAVLLSQSLIAGPKLTVRDDHYQFGTVPQNCKVAHTFWLHSSGDDTVTIVAVIPGCDCTEAPLQKAILPPGDSTPLEVTFATGSYVGLVSKQPTIRLKGGLPDMHVQFRCNVAVRPDSTFPIVIKPIAVDLTQFGETAKTEARVTVANVSSRDVGISVVSVPEDVLEFEIPSTIRAGESVTGTVRLKPDGSNRQFDKSITLKLTDDRSSRFTIPVHRGAPK